MSITARIGRLLAATLMSVAAGAVVLGSPAMASGACAKGTGVTVVVGSGVSCDANGGGYAASNFRDTGHSLTYVQKFPGAVCKVDGYPDTQCVVMPPENAYWGLFWSNGTSGSWNYANVGVDGLKVPTGGWVAFVFQNSSGKTYPGVKPLAAAPPAPKPKPTATTKPKPSASTSAAARGVTPSTSATPSAGATALTTPGPTGATPSASGTEPTIVPGDTTKSSSQEVPSSRTASWVAPVLVVGLLVGMGAALVRRRITGGRAQ